MSRVLYRYLPCFALAFFLAGCTPSQKANSSQNSPARATAPALPAAAPMPPQATATEQAKAAQEQRVKVLIEQVEKAYANGQTDFRKGDLPAAKAEFDRAVDLMLTSGIDIKSDSALQSEFDHVVDAVNGLEMDALKEGK